ncbi:MULTISPECIES: site-specific integrase [unclassified Ruegeria]|uniref:tyrosine-type recombinase/integrase n=1 Tax=unclassified Ruegeria TaxID=2625375 RepID=UPI001490C875|nr:MULTISPECIES: site-specific integrase [unclassified Ruegeria]NOD37080.1 tyrosine-type recombinase/integrase [Ruegeria sp. HKCCD7296]NOE44242.1 tyrosine-type recombinase/integrase [Ruegeria sp. HKCCD7319]
MATIVKRPSGKWQATVRKDGQSRSMSFHKRADATKWARETELSADRGLLTPALCVGASEMTLGEVLRKYRDDVTSEKRCADNESYAINGFLRKCSQLANKKVNKLRSADFVHYRDQRIKSMKAATVVRELGWLQHALDVACDDWGQNLPQGNPVKPVRRPKIDNRRERRLQEGEWQALLNAVNQSRSPLMKPLLTLALATGMRRGELLSMQWRHVDLERRTVFLPQTKNGRARTVPLSPNAVAVLMDLPRADDRCLPLSGNSVRLAFERLRQRAGVIDLTFHDLRHEAVSRFVESGLSLAQVQMISGHRDLRMLMRYTHLQTDDIVAKLAAVGLD